MNRMALTVLAAVALAAGTGIFLEVRPQPAQQTPVPTPAVLAPVPARVFTMTSPDLSDNGLAPPSIVNDGYGCQGDNISPQISWSDAPAGTGSFAFTVFDGDAKAPQGWLHWFVLDIPATAAGLATHAGYEDDSGLPQGAYSIPNSFGKNGYGGPCPPEGDKPHRYVFTVYAMPDKKTAYDLNVIGKSTVDWLQANALAKASVTVRYGR